MNTQNLLKRYIESKKQYDKLASEIGVLIVNGIRNERYKQIEIEAKHLEGEMNSISRRFIEGFIIE